MFARIFALLLISLCLSTSHLAPFPEVFAHSQHDHSISSDPDLVSSHTLSPHHHHQAVFKPMVPDQKQVDKSRHLLTNDTKARIEAIRQRYHVPGVAVAVVRHDEGNDNWITDYGLFGVADVLANPISDETYFSIASNSKLFVILSLGMLIENGTKLHNGQALSWTTRIRDILPEWSLGDPWAGEHLTIEDLASMRSGLPAHNGALRAENISSSMERIKALSVSAEPRQYWQYCNHHYTILAHLITRMTGTGYTTWLQQHILDPLDMRDTTFNITQVRTTARSSDAFVHSGRDTPNCSSELRKRGIELELDAVELPESCVGQPRSVGRWNKGDLTFLQGSGGVISTPRDIVKWLRELLSPRVIPPSALHQATLPVAPMDLEPLYPEVSMGLYGMAQRQLSYRHAKNVVFGHSGSLFGQKSHLMRTRTASGVGWGVAVMINDEDFGVDMVDVVGNIVLDQLLDLPPIDWEKRILYKRLASNSSEAATADTGYTLPQSQHRFAPSMAIKATDLVGKYLAPGYGSIDILPLTEDHIDPRLMADMERTLASHGYLTHDEGLDRGYFALFPSVSTTHILFTPYMHNTTYWRWTLFNTNLVQSPQGPTDEWISGLYSSGRAICTRDGIGMFDDFWQGGPSVVAQRAELELNVIEENAEKRAEVWFAKVL